MAGMELAGRPGGWPRRLTVLLVGLAVATLSLVIALVLVLAHGDSRGARVDDEFDGEVTGISSSRNSICVARPDDSDEDCGLPIISPQTRVRVGDLVTVTVVKLTHDDLTEDGFFVRPR